MSESIIVALITGLSAVLCQVFINLATASKQRIQNEVWRQQVKDKIDSVDKKLTEHNGYAEKFASLTETIIAMKKDIEYLKEVKNK